MDISRRAALGVFGAGLAVLGLRTARAAEPGLAPDRARHPVTGAAHALRLAQLNDSHLPAEGQNERFVNCLRGMQADPDPPQFVLFGGDNVNCVNAVDAASAEAQFANWNAMLQAELRLPHYSVIGNHDIWNGLEPGSDPRLGKGMALAAYGMPARYYAFSQEGWRFLLLDTFHDDGCYIDPEQLAWLASEIDAAREHVCLLSHAPILSAAVLIDAGSQAPPGWKVPANYMVNNVLELRELLYARPQVRLALSGHLHQAERLDYDNLSFLCNGAVSGLWWNGEYNKFPPAYAMLDLYEDGSFLHEVRFWEQEA